MLLYVCQGHVFQLCIDIKSSRGLFSAHELDLLNVQTQNQYDITRVFCVPTFRGPLYVVDYTCGHISCSVDWPLQSLMPASS